MNGHAIPLTLLALLGPVASAREGGETPQERAIIAFDQVADIDVEFGAGGLERPVIGLKVANGKLNARTLAHLKVLPHLRALQINADLDPSALAPLAGLTELRVLDLGGTTVGDAALAHVRGLTRLRAVNLAGTKVTDAGLRHLAGLRDLRVLSLSYTPIGDEGVAHLRRLASLSDLDLSGTKLTDEGLAFLKDLRGLTRLRLGRTRVHGPGLAHLARLDGLSYVGLRGAPVTARGLKHLPAAKALRWVDLRETDVRPAGLRQCPRGAVRVEEKGTTAVLRDARTGEPVGPPLRHPIDRRGGAITCRAFSPDGKWLAVGAGYAGHQRGEKESLGALRVWEVTTGKLVADFKDTREGTLGRVEGVAFCADGKTLLFRADRFEEDGR